MDTGELIRAPFGIALRPWSPWCYLWHLSLERVLSRVLDVTFGYEPGSDGWPLDAAFLGCPVFDVRAFEGARFMPPPPVLAVVPFFGKKPNLHDVRRGLVVYPADPIAEAFEDAWEQHGELHVRSLKDWSAARAAAKRHVLHPSPQAQPVQPSLPWC